MNDKVYHEKTELTRAQHAINSATILRKTTDGVPIEVKASVSDPTVVVTPQTGVVHKLKLGVNLNTNTNKF